MKENELIEDLIRDEGLVLNPYECSEGYLSIGVGRNLEQNGINKEEAMLMLKNDLKWVYKSANKFKWYHHLSEKQQRAVCNMLFNLGLTRFLKFKKMIKALEEKDYTEASKQALDSRWARQVGDRAKRIAIMLKGC